jgi:predicted SPOUT superfamily RNA methylase MTH1
MFHTGLVIKIAPFYSIPIFDYTFRALAVFNIDEVIVFDDLRKLSHRNNNRETTKGEFNGVGKHGDGCLQLARILQFLECPQYLRKHFFPLHKDLQYAGVLNPTDMPHHLRASEFCEYREGVVLDRPPTKTGSLVRPLSFMNKSSSFLQIKFVWQGRNIYSTYIGKQISIIFLGRILDSY